MSETTVQPWQMLDADLHLHTLEHKYAPGVLEMIKPEPKRILDVGCFCGGAGLWLKNRFPGCEVVGIEKLGKAAEEASQIYDRVIVGAFEQIDFTDNGLDPKSFDAIIAGDVLEHLYNPWQALQRLKPLLSSGGAIYISLPNIRNLMVLSELASGSWRYTGAGLLDITHIRFFTRVQALEMLQQTGWTVTEIRMNPDRRLAGAFGEKSFDEIKSVKIDRLTIEGLNPMDVMELTTLQFFFRAQPA
jgi:2-polyprenyl-3-methyl-5-hydroxy-6-metoxy-1,4-benzoquinol methylase